MHAVADACKRVGNSAQVAVLRTLILFRPRVYSAKSVSRFASCMADRRYIGEDKLQFGTWSIAISSEFIDPWVRACMHRLQIRPSRI